MLIDFPLNVRSAIHWKPLKHRHEIRSRNDDGQFELRMPILYRISNSIKKHDSLLTFSRLSSSSTASLRWRVRMRAWTLCANFELSRFWQKWGRTVGDLKADSFFPRFILEGKTPGLLPFPYNFRGLLPLTIGGFLQSILSCSTPSLFFCPCIHVFYFIFHSLSLFYLFF